MVFLVVVAGFLVLAHVLVSVALFVALLFAGSTDSLVWSGWLAVCVFWGVFVALWAVGDVEFVVSVFVDHVLHVVGVCACV